MYATLQSPVRFDHDSNHRVCVYFWPLRVSKRVRFQHSKEITFEWKEIFDQTEVDKAKQ